jgi:hypothetical protein
MKDKEERIKAAALDNCGLTLGVTSDLRGLERSLGRGHRHLR